MYLYETFPCSVPQRLYKANMDWKVSQLLAETRASNTSGEVKNDIQEKSFCSPRELNPKPYILKPKALPTEPDCF